MSSKSKLIIVKPLQSNLININEALRTDIEASNRGISVLFTNGLLTIVAWVKKKVYIKRIEDVTDALWQKGGISEIVVTCHSGALIRYTVHLDTGLTKTLQLSAQSFLSLIAAKDSGIKSLKSLRIWGHTKNYILLQPQPDRLVLMSTNSGARPNVLGIVKTPSLQSAHISGNKIIVQPYDGSYIYIHDATTCKTTEAVSLLANKPGVSYIQWDVLACSFTASRFAITDNERRLYIANLEDKKYHGKKNGIKTYNLTLHQLVWPATFQPSRFSRFTLSLSDESLSVFCSTYIGEIEEYFYFIHETSEGGNLIFKYKFLKEVSLISGLSHELPDLFLTEEGLCMLTDKESPVPSTTKTKDFEELHSSLKEALKEWDMDKISDIKSVIEEDLGIFLSSCNHLKEWEDLVEMRSHQHAQLVDTLLTHLLKSAAESRQSSSSLLSLKELAKHHFKTLKDEVTNVLEYVDAGRVGQQLLKLDEQMNFYLTSVEAMKLPDGTFEERKLSEKFAEWGDRPVDEIIYEALSSSCIKMAEAYFGMKPWIYGQIDRTYVISTCVDVAREFKGQNLLMNMEELYNDELKEQLLINKDIKKIILLEEVLVCRKYLTERERFALYLVKCVHRLSPYIVLKQPKLWTDLVEFEEPPEVPYDKELTIATVLKWSLKSMHLILFDIYARMDDEEILSRAELPYLWSYFLKRKEEVQLFRWMNHQICGFDKIENLFSKMKITGYTLRSGVAKEKSKSKISQEKKALHVPPSVESLFGRQMYSSDTESTYSLDSSVWEGIDESIKGTSESTDDSSTYLINDWSSECFIFIDQEMIDEVPSSSFDLQEKLLNLLAQYGLFVTQEKDNAEKIIQRLISVDSSFLSFRSLSSEYTHKISKSTLDDLVLDSYSEDDLKSPFYEYVYANNLNLRNVKFTLDREKSWIKLVSPFQTLAQNMAKEVIYDLCLETLKYFLNVKDDFTEEYVSVFLTMLYAPNASLSDFLHHSEDVHELAKKDVEALSSILKSLNLTPTEVVQELADESFPFLRTMIQEPLSITQIDISVYELLRGSVPFDIGNLFTWQKFNKFGYCEDVRQPSFNDEDLNSKEGVKCSMDYYYYLKAGRPTYALASVLLSVYSSEESEEIQSKELPVYGLALSSWPDKRICSACVALLFIAQLNYEPLRTILYTADLIIDMLEQHGIETKVHKNLMKSQINFFTQEVKGILFRLCGVSTRNEAANQLLALLEDTLISRLSERPLSIESKLVRSCEEERKEPCKVDFSSKEVLHNVFTGLKLACELSNIYNLNPPQKILDFLVEENRWLLFLVAVQLFQYSPDTILKISNKFVSHSVKEHIKFCLDVKTRKCPEGEMFKEETVQDYEEVEDESEAIKECSSNTNQGEEENLPVKGKRKTRRRRGKSFTVGSSQSLIPFIGSMESNSFKNKKSCDGLENSKEMTKQSVIEKWKCDERNWDVFSLVLYCHKREKPALELLEASIDLRSSLLAVIAACYDKNLRRSCLASWLYSYIPQRIIKKIKSKNFSYNEIYFPCKLDQITSIDYFEKLLTFYFAFEHIDIVIEAFKIFESGNSVITLMEAFKCTKNGSNVDEVSRILAHIEGIEEDSAEKLSDLKDQEDNFFILILCQGIDFYLKNRSLQKVFIEALLPFSERGLFKMNKMDWSILLEMLKVLESTSVPVKIFNFYSSTVEINLDLVANNLIKFLIDINDCEKAFRMAKVVGLKIEDIFCCQIEAEFEAKKKLLLTISNMKDFLYETHNRVTEKEVNTRRSAYLFESLAKSVMSPTYSYLAMQYAVIWRQMDLDVYETLRKKPPDGVVEDSDKFELHMWCKCIEANIIENLDLKRPNLVPPPLLEKWPWEYGGNVQDLHYEAFIFNSTVSYKIHKNGNFKKPIAQYLKVLLQDHTPEMADGKLRSRLQIILKEMMKNDMLVTALRLEDLFGIGIKDLDLLKDLLKKACEENLLPVTTPSLQSWEILESPVEVPSNKKIPSLSLKLTSFPNLNFIEESGSAWLKNICLIIKEFSEYYNFAKRILMLCRIAEELSINYLTLIRKKKASDLLIELLTMENAEYFQLAKELIEAYPIPEEEVSLVLFEELRKSISVGPVLQSSERRTNSFLKWESLDRRWPELLSLVDSPSSIGFNLMDSFRDLSKDCHPDSIANAHLKGVETLIRAHDCFTQAANMEGINAVLTSSLVMTKALLKHNQWTLMGRLLTGIKRYKEMSYIIDIMKEHQQFERLLGRTGEKSEKVQSTGLDKTLLHFLYHNYPEEKELLRMVASHFLVFSELAKMWEEEAERIMRNVLEASLYEKPLEECLSERSPKGIFFLKRTEDEESSTASSSSSFPERDVIKVDYLKNLKPSLLIEALHCYCFASQYCIEEKQMMSALNHSRQAELISVQLNLYKRSTDNLVLRVIKLTPIVLNLVMTQFLQVNEHIVVARAYGLSPDWGSTLYFHYIKNGDSKFLEEFLKFSPLSEDIVLDIVKRIERNGLESDHKERMGKLLSHVSDVDLIYKVASQLDLRTKVEQCLESKATCFLKDTVFSKGVAGSGRL